MAKPLFIAFYPSDWRAGVANLSTVERALYHEICMVIWETGEGVKERDILRLLRDDAEVLHDAVETLIRFGKITREGDELVNRRAMEEHANALNRKEAGKKGAAGRWKKDATALRPQSDGMRSAYANQTQTQNQKPDTEPEGRKPNAHAREASEPDRFGIFWSVYPRKKGSSRKKAAKAYATRLKQGHTAEEIITGARMYATLVDVAEVEERYVKLAETFVGPNCHFLDDHTPPEKPGDWFTEFREKLHANGDGQAGVHEAPDGCNGVFAGWEAEGASRVENEAAVLLGGPEGQVVDADFQRHQ